tara:strand:+ start:154 stop:711 length:558 start_codon:yes stop_codon:yes gene_type:complete
MGFKSGPGGEVGAELKLSYDGSNSTTLTTTAAGALTITTTAGFVSAGGQLSYRGYAITTKANGYTMLISETGGVVYQQTSHTTPSNVVINLPATAAGVVYTFVYAGTPGQGFQISPNASDAIMGSIIDVATGNVVTAANNGLGVDNKDLILGGSGSKIGDRVTLMGDGNFGWIITEGLGKWSFES